jgi:hypothetical protein
MHPEDMKRPLFHPLGLNALRHALRLLNENGPVDEALRYKVPLALACAGATAPLRALENLLFGRAIRRTELKAPPIFILGHWRTGTTFLHNGLCQDPHAGYITTYQTLLPEACRVARPFLHPVLRATMPATRPMDNVPITPDSPQEEEYALCNMTEHAFYNALYFPRRLRTLFDRYVLFEGITPDELSAWKRDYHRLLQKTSFLCGGRRLVLKNPANTARIRVLLEMYPQARFIHIHRDPFVVFKSTRRLYLMVQRMVGLQEVSAQEIEDFVLYAYRAMMERYLCDCESIPAENLIEVAYDDMQQRPLQIFHRIYDQFALPGWEAARPHIEAFIASQAGHRKNQFHLSDEDITKVESHWDFALALWGTGRPEAAAV